MTYSFCDVEGFAGALSVGATLAGMKLVGKRELPGGFGIPMMEANRAFLGDDWKAQISEAEAWEPIRADVIGGTPPCSAFSGMTAGYAAHGMDSKINECMYHAVRFAARCRPAVFVMESVSQAFTNGKVLMQRLAQELNEQSGLAYRTTHVLQDNYSLGGVTKRKRYFLVLSQVPFGIEVPELKWLPVLGDALSDLRSLPLSWEEQRITASPTWWSHHLRSSAGTVDGHNTVQNSYTRRQLSLIRDHVRWEEGDSEAAVLNRYYDAFSELPEEFRYEAAGKHKGLTRDKVLLDRGLNPGGFSQARCWAWNVPGRVVNGAGPYMVMHPDGRLTTNREIARIMGFPDAWKIAPLQNDPKLHSYWGKGTSVSPAEWVCTWIRESLDGSPGSVIGDLQPDGSRLIDISKNWQAVEKRLAAAPHRTETVPLPTRPPVIKPSKINRRLAADLGMTGDAVPIPSISPEVLARTADLISKLPPKPERQQRTTPTPAVPRSEKPEKWRSLLPSGFQVRPEDEYAVREVMTGAYDKLNIRPGDRVLDLGAHTGAFAIWACQRGAPHVLAVEMLPQTVAVLRENVSNTLVDVWYGAAVFDGPAVAVLGNRANPMKASVLGTRLETEPSATRYQKLAVPAFSVAELLEASRPDIIKFSIEASEGFILTPHARDFAARGVRQLIGLHHISDARLLEKSRKLHAALVLAGYDAGRAAPSKPSGWAATICYTLR
jgi:FkbM family methyltransferase